MLYKRRQLEHINTRPPPHDVGRQTSRMHAPGLRHSHSSPPPPLSPPPPPPPPPPAAVPASISPPPPPPPLKQKMDADAAAPTFFPWRSTPAVPRPSAAKLQGSIRLHSSKRTQQPQQLSHHWVDRSNHWKHVLLASPRARSTTRRAKKRNTISNCSFCCLPFFSFLFPFFSFPFFSFFSFNRPS